VFSADEKDRFPREASRLLRRKTGLVSRVWADVGDGLRVGALERLF